MGQFESGIWIVILLTYFFCFFMIVYCIQAGFPGSGVSVSDPGFGSSPLLNTTIGDVDPAASVSSGSSGMSNVRSTVGIMTGFTSSSSNIGVPGGWMFAFSFVFFYLPAFMLLWAVYMALPIIH